MRLCELFSTVHEPIPITGEEAKRYDLIDVIQAYLFEVNSIKYICYFTNDKSGYYSVHFGKIVETPNNLLKVSHFLTKLNDSPLKVLGFVFHCIRLFIDQYHPVKISMTGAQQRQQEFYKNILPKLTRLIPSGYVGSVAWGHLSINKKETVSFLI